jgi:15-cis-phytoene synthase
MDDAFRHCEALLRAADKERFLATLFAPAEFRPAMFALYAFNLEIARTREAAFEPLAGEIRLQWWSDMLAGEGRGEIQGHPVAAALLATIAKYRLERRHLQALIDARGFDLYDEPMRTLAEFEAYAQAVSANLIALCAQILAHGREPGIAEIACHAGMAHAVAGLLAAFPIHSRRGQLYVPLELLQRHGTDREDAVGNQGGGDKRAGGGLRAALAEFRQVGRCHLDRARELMGTVPAGLMPAFLPVALAPVMLRQMERDDYDPFALVEIPPWRRQWAIWRAARRPARIFE